MNPTSLLQKGKRYSVISVGRNGRIYVENYSDKQDGNLEGSSYNASRFVLVEAEQTTTTPTKDQEFLAIEANKILCAEIKNGVRDHWIFDFGDDKTQKIVASSVKMAQMLIKEAKK